MFNKYKNIITPPYSKKDIPYLLITLLILVLIPFTVIYLNQQTLDRSQASESWILQGSHPKASLQSTSYGKTLHTLQPLNGKLYIGYGDSGGNTGPIYVTHFEPSSNTFVEDHLLNTEEIRIYREINGKLYAPVIDRKGTAISYASGESWVDQPFSGADAEHNKDMATLTGTDLWLVTHSAYSRVWRSMDNGKSWTNVLSSGVRVKLPTGGNAYTFIGVYKGKVYVQATDLGPTGETYAHARSKVFDGTRWSDGPDLLPDKAYDSGYKPLVFADKMIYRSFSHLSSAYKQKLYVFNGTSVINGFSKPIYDYALGNGVLYILAEDGTINKTTDLINWETVTPTAPLTARSIAVMNNTIYVGTTDSTLYSYEITDSTPSISPTITQTLTNTPAPTTPFISPTPTVAPPTATTGPVDTTKPTVSITSPLNGASVTVKTNVNIQANATDNVGIDRVVFTVGGNTSTDYTAPYSYNWSIPGAANKSYVISATAYDARGNSSSSQITVRSIR